MIIDDKSGTRSSQPPQESQMVCRNVQINRTIVRLSARPFRQDSRKGASPYPSIFELRPGKGTMLLYIHVGTELKISTKICLFTQICTEECAGF